MNQPRTNGGKFAPKPNTVPKTTTETPARVRGTRKALLAPPVGIESIEAAMELAENPKALELAAEIAKLTEKHNRALVDITALRGQVELVKRDLAHAESLVNKIANLFGTPAWDALPDLVGNLAKERREALARAAEYREQRDSLQQLLTNSEDAARGWENTAQSRLDTLQGRNKELQILRAGMADLTQKLGLAEAHAANLQDGNARLCADLNHVEQGLKIVVRDAREAEDSHIWGNLGAAGIALILSLIAFFAGRAL